MAIRIKEINGQKYLYHYTTKRIGGKVRQFSKYFRKATPSDLILIPTLIKSGYFKQKDPLMQSFDEGLKYMSKRKGIPVNKLAMGGNKLDSPIFRANLKLHSSGFPIVNSVIPGKRVAKSDPRGTLNATGIYQLARIKDELERLEVYKYLKLKKVRLARDIQLIVNVVITRKGFRCKDYLKVHPDILIHQGLLMKYLNLKLSPVKEYQLLKLNEQIDKVESKIHKI